MKKILFLIVLIIACIFLYGRYLEPNFINIREYTIESEKISESFEELKIVHFSDLLYDNDEKKLEKLEKKINSLDADIIIFTGNLFNSDFKYEKEDYENLKKFLSNLNASLYKYSIIGKDDESLLENYKDIMYESEFKILDNSNMLLFYKDVTPINIIGIKNTDNIDELLNTDPEFSLSLVITQNPDITDSLKDYNIDVVLSGLTLGGYINLPFYGGIISNNKYINDYYDIEKTKLYISNGLGYKKLNFRLFNTPSINIYRFKKLEKIDS